MLYRLILTDTKALIARTTIGQNANAARTLEELGLVAGVDILLAENALD